ncbi:MAG: CAP domain-containing protein [Trueperaceae bacterium]
MVALVLLAVSISLAHAQAVTVDAELEQVLHAQLTAAVNAARRAEGLAPLEPEPLLATAAGRHAREMATMGYFGHVSPVTEHAGLSQRVAAAGSPLVDVGENLARIGAATYLEGLVRAYAGAGRTEAFGAGATTTEVDVVAASVADAIVRGWLDSPGHRRNLLDASFDRVGFGVAYDPALGLVVVQVLGWEPAMLRDFRVEPVVETRLRTVVRVRAEQDVDVILSFDGAPATPRRLTAGVQEIELEALVDDATLAIGVRGTDGRYVLDDVVDLDAGAIAASASLPASDAAGARGTLRRNQATPRRSLTILAAFGRADERAGLRVHAEYDAPATLALTMLVNDEALPGTASAPGEASSPGVFDAFLPLSSTDGAPTVANEGSPVVTVAFGLDLGDGRVRLFHRFAYNLSGAVSDAGAARRAGATR